MDLKSINRPIETPGVERLAIYHNPDELLLKENYNIAETDLKTGELVLFTYFQVLRPASLVHTDNFESLK